MQVWSIAIVVSVCGGVGGLVNAFQGWNPDSAEQIIRIPPEVANRLGYYLYLYSDPRD